MISACNQPAGEAPEVEAADPAIITAPAGHNGYYVFSTGYGVPIWHSDDRLHWTLVGRVFEDPVPKWAKALIPGSDDVWAPDISFHNGLYYLYYAVSTLGAQRSVIGLAVNRTIDPADRDYKWEERGLVIESSPSRNDFNAIDPALFADKDGNWYLFFGSFFSGIKVVRIDPQTGKPFADNNPVVALAARPGKLIPSIEGAYVISHDGYYYLFVSWDFCCFGPLLSNYKVAVGRSHSVIGPYADRAGRKMVEGGGTVILQSSLRWRGPGHNSVLSAANGDYLVHHTYDMRNWSAVHFAPGTGRMLQVRPMYWSADGWPYVGEPLLR